MSGKIASDEVYQVPGTFMGVPASRELSGVKAAVLGIPYDMGTHPTRIGSRQGPDAIRAQSSHVRPWVPELDFNPVERLGLVDCGNVRLTASRLEDAHARIEAALRPLVEAGVTPITMGGDGSVSLPQLRALHTAFPEIALLHFDAHTDAYPPPPGERHTTGTTFYWAREEGLVDPASSLHIGIRGSTYQRDPIGVTRAQGYEVIGLDEMFERGLDPLLAHIHERLAGKKVYLCWDLDFFDPAVAPGVCTPAWGGVSAREGLYLLRRLAGLDFIAFDVNTLSPPHDLGGMTAILAGNVMLEFLFLACRRPG